MRSRRVAGAAISIGLAMATISALPAQAAVSTTCAGKKATILGTDGADWEEGTPGLDVISLGDGNDFAVATDGDVICLGAGNDDAAQFKGSARIYGDAGDDRMQAGGTATTFYGGDVNDTFRRQGALGTDRVYGGNGDDRISVHDSTVVLKVGTGRNSVTVDQAHQKRFVFNLATGTWTLSGVTRSLGGPISSLSLRGTTADKVTGSGGQDWITFGPGDAISAGGGDDVLFAARSANLSQVGGTGVDLL